MLQVFINGSLIEMHELAYNSGLNFSRFSNNYKPISFLLKTDKSSFTRSLESYYNTIKEEIKIDDQTYNDTSDFSIVNYCSLNDLLHQPDKLLEIFNTYLRDIYFKDFSNNKAKFMINSIDEIRVNEIITIRGKAYKI